LKGEEGEKKMSVRGDNVHLKKNYINAILKIVLGSWRSRKK
jgi:hypothetical protein